jgi:hypothetical protein
MISIKTTAYLRVSTIDQGLKTKSKLSRIRLKYAA